MRSLRIGFAFLLVWAMGAAIGARLSVAEEVPPQATQLDGWKLVWQDEFEGEELDPAEWEQLYLPQSHNREKQFYVPEQIALREGMLVITATDEPMEDKKYRSGRLWTQQQWLHGRFEARIQLPTSQGMWPAYWLLPRDLRWPSGGEIDIVEGFGSDPFVASSAYHWGKDWDTHKYVHNRHRVTRDDGTKVNYHDSFHLYAVEWEADEIRFYVDGEQHFRVTGDEAPVSQTGMAVILNLAVGGWFDGDPDETTQFPQSMLVDYVRVWQRPKAE